MRMKILSRLMFLVGVSLSCSASGIALGTENVLTNHFHKHAPINERLDCKPSDEEYSIMFMMEADSIPIISNGYWVSRNLRVSDLEAIEKWKSENSNIVDEWLMKLAFGIFKLSTETETYNDVLYPNSYTQTLNDILKESIDWRRSNLEMKKLSKENRAELLDEWINQVEKKFGGEEMHRSMVKSVYLNSYERALIDLLNFLNGSKFIDSNDGVIDVGQLGRMKDWCWANEGNLPEEALKNLNKDIVFEIYYAFEGSPEFFEDFKESMFKSEIFDKYREIKTVKIK